MPMPLCQRLLERAQQMLGLRRVVPVLGQGRNPCELFSDPPLALGDVPVRNDEVLALLIQIEHGEPNLCRSQEKLVLANGVGSG